MTPANDSVLIVAGEASGDLHGSKVVARLRELAPDLSVYGVGGDRMRDAGMDLAFHADDFAVVGLVEVVGLLPRLRRAMRDLVATVRERGTRLAILIDYPGFNLMLARRLKAEGVSVFYYISPQVWAWGEGRVSKIARRVDRMAVVLPFEERFYAERGVDAEFVGHPLLEEPGVAVVPAPKASLGDPPVLGLLPGSRRNEIALHLPPMLEAVSILRADLGRLDVRLARAPGVDDAVLREVGGVADADVEIFEQERTHELVRDATALLVSSGTATLEAACLGTPMVVLYRMALLSYLAGRALVRIPDIGLVNVVAGERVVPELVQNDVTGENLAREVRPFLTDGELLERTSRRLLQVRSGLGEPGASDRVAKIALEMLASSAREGE
jgi:lipid-A-disaccharide synthase